MTRFIFMGLFFILPLTSLGQEDSILKIPDNALSWYNPVTNTDSLKNLMEHAYDHARVDLLCELVFALQRKNRNDKRLLGFLDEAFNLAEKIDYNDGRIKTLLLIGYRYRMVENDFHGSIEVLQKAEKFFEPQTHWTLMFRIWTILAHNFQNIGDSENATLYFQKSHLYLDKDTAWYAFIKSHHFLLQQASLMNDHIKKRQNMEELGSLFKQHEEYLLVQGFRLLDNVEELSINMANYGEYKDALELMLWVMEVLDKEKGKSFYVDFYHAKIMSRIARIYSHWGRYDDAINCFDESIGRFEKLYRLYGNEMEREVHIYNLRQWYISVANQLEERADVLIRKGIFMQAEKDLLESIEIRTKYPDPLGVAMCYDKLGELYAIRGKFLEALQWYDLSLDVKRDVIENELSKVASLATRILFARESISSTYLKKGRLFKDWNRIQTAFEYFTLSLSVSREAGFQRGEAEALIEMGNLYMSTQRNQLALEFYQQSASIYEIMGHRPGKANVMEKMGNFYFQQGRISEALVNYRQSKRIFDELDMPARKAALLIRQGSLFASENKNQEATSTFAEALHIAEQLNLPRLKMEASKGLADCYSSMGLYRDAFATYKNYREIKDTLFTLEVERQMAEIEVAYETQQNRQELLLLQREKELMEIKEIRARLIIILMVAFIAIMLLWILLYFRHSNLKNGHEKIILQQKMFRSQLNPHFIFNSLGSIQSSILNEEPDKAVKYISRFSRLMRNILDSSDNELIPLSKEIATIENYLALQKVRFTNKFDFLVNVDDHIDAEIIFIPPMLAQPFIENAIEHGIKPMETKGQININIQLQNDILTIEIEDNGIGRKKAGELLQKQDKDHKSMAIDITRKRIEVINRKSKHPIRFAIEDLCHENAEAAGTRVVFDVPV